MQKTRPDPDLWLVYFLLDRKAMLLSRTTALLAFGALGLGACAPVAPSNLRQSADEAIFHADNRRFVDATEPYSESVAIVMQKEEIRCDGTEALHGVEGLLGAANCFVKTMPFEDLLAEWAEPLADRSASMIFQQLRDQIPQTEIDKLSTACRGKDIPPEEYAFAESLVIKGATGSAFLLEPISTQLAMLQMLGFGLEQYADHFGTDEVVQGALRPLHRDPPPYIGYEASALHIEQAGFSSAQEFLTDKLHWINKIATRRILVSAGHVLEGSEPVEDGDFFEDEDLTEDEDLFDLVPVFGIPGYENEVRGNPCDEHAFVFGLRHEHLGESIHADGDVRVEPSKIHFCDSYLNAIKDRYDLYPQPNNADIAAVGLIDDPGTPGFGLDLKAPLPKKICSLGHPNGVAQAISEGALLSRESSAEQYARSRLFEHIHNSDLSKGTTLRTRLNTDQGSSGSPAFDCDAGTLLGVINILDSFFNAGPVELCYRTDTDCRVPAMATGYDEIIEALSCEDMNTGRSMCIGSFRDKEDELIDGCWQPIHYTNADLEAIPESHRSTVSTQAVAADTLLWLLTYPETTPAAEHKNTWHLDSP